MDCSWGSPGGGMDGLDDIASLLANPQCTQGMSLEDLLPLQPLDGGNLDLKAELLSDDDSTPCTVGPYGMMRMGVKETGGEADPSGTTGAEGKRRRRIRNAKQQELNRLAQQRYRQRKKKKYTDLQSTVEELTASTDEIQRLEDEADELLRREADAVSALARRDVELATAGTQLAAQGRALAETRAKLTVTQGQLATLLLQQHTARQRNIAAAAAVAAASAAAAAAAATTAAAVPTPTPAVEQQPRASVSTSGAAPAGKPPPLTEQQLCDKLITALSVALGEVCKEHGLSPSPEAQTSVLGRLRRSLQPCCRDVLFPQQSPGAIGVSGAVGCGAGGALLPAALPQPAPVGAHSSGMGHEMAHVVLRHKPSEIQLRQLLCRSPRRT
ncbi:hypothetical protein FOA52_011599 [Chlamydomonas sp. UWO 241]|nr:hypothetical protein FOA52_011599 [Chlamydomonas sp. UWO 241]